MCIRDSYKVFDTQLERYAALKVLNLKSNQNSTFVERFKSCLLYTSDAADERSSVDLGGRRIIKKKKQVEL